MYKKSLGLIILAALMVFTVGCSRDKNPADSNSASLQMRPNTPDAPALGGRVWHDVNRDGIQGMFEDEPGMPGAIVQLYLCINDSIVFDTLPPTAVTDSFGFYAFDQLEPGEYYLHFLRPDGYIFTLQDQGDNDSLDSDVNIRTGTTPCITVDTGTVDLNWSAGVFSVEIPEGMIGDRVWLDMNQDGIQDDPMDEPGVAGVMVHLFRCSDTMISDTLPIARTATNERGFYFFKRLEAGHYAVKFKLPDGYMFSPADQGDDDALDSDADPMTGMTACFAIDSTGMKNPDQDAGIYMPDPGCTRSKGYWKNHAGLGPQDDMVTDLLPIWLGASTPDSIDNKSLLVIDAQMAVDILQQHTYGEPSNGITKLYAQLLAAKLNIANGASAMDIEDYIAEADEFLIAHDWMDWDGLDKEQQKMILAWKDVFDDYNNGEIGPGYCGDMDGDDYDDMR